MVYTKRRIQIRNSKNKSSQSKKNTRIGGTSSRFSQIFSSSPVPIENSTRRSRSSLPRTLSLNKDPKVLSPEKEAKKTEIQVIIDNLATILENASKQIETYQKIKKDLEPIDRNVAGDNTIFNGREETNQKLKIKEQLEVSKETSETNQKLKIKEQLEVSKETSETSLMELFNMYRITLEDINKRIDSLDDVSVKTILNKRLRYYIGNVDIYGKPLIGQEVIQGTHTNTIISFGEIYKLLNKEEKKEEEIYDINPMLNKTILEIVNSDDSYKKAISDMIQEMIQESNHYSDENKIYVYGTLVYYLMAQIKSKGEVFNEADAAKVSFKRPVKFIENDIFMQKKDTLNDILVELQRSTSVKEVYTSLEKVFELLKGVETI